uniref:Uncharacterized protein n=1 Tax=viral metagenome TaxID=1070528 RepID=A0A6M3KYW2_9ZZZZ
MARASLTTKADEGSTYVVRATYYDEDSNAVTPDSVVWTLTDGDGAIVNSREDVSIAVPSTYNDIVLGAADLKCSSGKDETRVLMLEYVYDSSAGNNLPGTAQVSFIVQKLQTVVAR